MSPMAGPTIKELDGLPAGEIQLLIANSERATVVMMQDKLDEHRGVIEGRLDQQDERLGTMQSDLSALVGTSKVTGLVAGIQLSIDSQIAQQRTWHVGDLKYRGTMTERMTAIENETKLLSGQVEMIRWFVASSRNLSRFLRVVLQALRTMEFYKLFGVGFALWLVNHFSPALYRFFVQILPH